MVSASLTNYISVAALQRDFFRSPLAEFNTKDDRRRPSACEAESLDVGTILVNPSQQKMREKTVHESKVKDQEIREFRVRDQRIRENIRRTHSGESRVSGGLYSTGKSSQPILKCDERGRLLTPGSGQDTPPNPLKSVQHTGINMGLAAYRPEAHTPKSMPQHVIKKSDLCLEIDLRHPPSGFTDLSVKRSKSDVQDLYYGLYGDDKPVFERKKKLTSAIVKRSRSFQKLFNHSMLSKSREYSFQ